MGLFSLTNLTLRYNDDYIEAGLTPIFIPPQPDSKCVPEQEVVQQVKRRKCSKTEDSFITYAVDVENFSLDYCMEDL